MLATRWTALIASCFGMLCAGTLYVFGLWSESVATILPANHGDDLVNINELFQFALLGNYLPFAGFFYSRYGPASTMLMGAFFNCTGYSVLAFAEFAQWHPPFWILAIAFACFGHGQGYIDAACMGAGLLRCSHEIRGTIAGLLKGFYGISGSIYTLVFLSGLSTKQLLFVLGPVNGLIVCTAAYFVRQSGNTTSDEPEEDEKRQEVRLANVLSVCMFVLTVFLFSASVLEGVLEDSKQHTTLWLWLNAVLIGLLVVIMTLPCSLGLQSTQHAAVAIELPFRPIDSSGGEQGEADAEEASFKTNEAAESTAVPLDGMETESLLAPPSGSSSASPPSALSQLPLRRALLSFEFLSIFSVLALGMGAGLMVVANFARIIEAKGGGEDARNVLLSVFSISNCLGRIAIGKLSDSVVLRRPACTRPFFLGLVTLWMALGHLLLGWAPGLASAYLAVPVVGAGYGAFWTLDPTLVHDFFGDALFGKVYGVMSMSPGVGSVLLSTTLASYVYSLNSTEGSGEPCKGVKCFQAAHSVIALALVAGTVVSMLLWRREQRSPAKG